MYFECTQCDDGYYLKAKDTVPTCFATTIIQNCYTYSLVNDLCTECNDGYYIAAD